MDENENARLHALIEGHVQGVGFRYFVLETAQHLKLTGWVRNTYEGQVEVLAEGQRPVLESLLTLLRKGPRAAYVTGVNADWQSPTGEYNSFSVRITAFPM